MTQDIITTITTKDDFKNTFISAQIKTTDKVMVHTALSKFYYVPGGPESLVQALEETINQGTIMMLIRKSLLIVTQRIGNILLLNKI